MRYRFSAPCCRPTGLNRRKRRGFVLLAVLFVLVVLSLAAYQFADLMTAEAHAADSYARSAQARAMAESGVHYTAAMLSDTNAYSGVLNSNPFSNSVFQGYVVQANDNPRLQGRFSVIAPFDPDDPGAGSQPYRFGVTDEGGKINLNALMQLDSSGTIAHNMLINLPNMTEDLANSILDWIDADSQPRTSGAENDYYFALNPPYSAKNAPLDTLDELLLVKGVTPRLLYGNDTNRNGILDPEEDDGSGGLDAGWSAYLTIYSRERNLNSQGNPRIYVNDSDLNGLYQKLSTALSPDMANYIIAYRLYGPASSAPSSGSQSTTQGSNSAASASPSAGRPSSSTGTASTVSGTGARTGTTVTGAATGTGSTGRGGSSGPAGGAGGGGSATLTRTILGNLSQGRPQSISSLYQLVNSQVSIPGSTPDAPPTVVSSPLNDPSTLRQMLPQLLDTVTTVNGAEIPARINVNTAPRAVLMTLPGLAESDVQNILAHRPSASATDAPDPIFQTTAWLITEANFSPRTLQTLDRYITAHSEVFRVQSVGYFDGGGPTARIEAVIDTNGGRPRIAYWRDLTELGKGFDLQSNQQQ
jgi:type II secretory pathway component PulK